MSDNQSREQLLQRLNWMKKELKKKEKKLQKSLRTSKAKEHVKRTLIQQQRLQSPDNQSECNELINLSGGKRMPDVRQACGVGKSGSPALCKSLGTEITQEVQNDLNETDFDVRINVSSKNRIEVNKNTKRAVKRDALDSVASGELNSHYDLNEKSVVDKSEIGPSVLPVTCSESSLTSSIPSSVENSGEVCSIDTNAKRSLSLNRKKRFNKVVCAKKLSSQSSDSQCNENLFDYINETENLSRIFIQNQTNNEKIWNSKKEKKINSNVDANERKTAEMVDHHCFLKEKESSSMEGDHKTKQRATQAYAGSHLDSLSWSADVECSSDTQIQLPPTRSRGRPKRKSLPSMNSKQVSRSKFQKFNSSFSDIHSAMECESEEFETLKLVQQYHTLGVESTTRHTRQGKTYHMPSLLSSIFQYFIDDTKRHKSVVDFSLPEKSFRNLMKKKLLHYDKNKHASSNKNAEFVERKLNDPQTMEVTEKKFNEITNISPRSEYLKDDTKTKQKFSEHVVSSVRSTPKSVSSTEMSLNLSPPLFPSQERVDNSETETVTSQCSNDTLSEQSLGDGIQSVSTLHAQELRHAGHTRLKEDLVSMHTGTIQTGRSKVEVILCLHLNSLSLWSVQGTGFLCTATRHLPENHEGIRVIGRPGISCSLQALVLSQTSTGHCIQVLTFSPHRGHHLTDSLHMKSESFVLCWLNQRDFSVAAPTESGSVVTKYCLDSCQTLKEVMCFDSCRGVLKCLQAVNNLPLALIGLTTTHVLYLWHTDTGTLVWEMNISAVWPHSSTIVYSAWQQSYVFLSVLADVPNEEAGVLMAVNPNKDTGSVVYSYSCDQWAGCLDVFPMDDYIAAADKNGSLFVWDKFTGEPCTVDLTVGISHAAQLGRKIIHGRKNCVHMFTVS